MKSEASKLLSELKAEQFSLTERRVDSQIKAKLQSTDQGIRSQIKKAQFGGDFHGDLVVAAHLLLSDNYNLYENYRQCYKSTEVEATLRGLKPDLLDVENQIIVECGLIEGGEDWYHHLLKGSDYGYRLENPSEWTIVNIPKSFFSCGDETHSELDEFVLRELRFTSNFTQFRDQFKERRRKERREAVHRVAQKIRESGNDFIRNY